MNVSESAWASVNGHLSLAAEAVMPIDSGLLRGDGCFETALLREGRVVALEQHLARLATSLAALRLLSGLQLAERLAAVRKDLRQLCECARPTEGIVRITVTAGLRLVELSPLPPRVTTRRRGLELHPLPEPRAEAITARHKTLAWNTHAVATRRHPRGADPSFEGVWLDPTGHLLEGTATNLFVWVDGVVLTPPLSRPILPGTARARALLALPRLGLPTAEADVRPSAMHQGWAFATSALLLAAPILSYDGEAVAPPPPELMTALRAALAST